MLQDPNAWVSCPSPNPQARLRLFCLPFAGGSAATYYRWPQSLPQEVEVCLIHLPGRQQRLVEPAIKRMTLLVDALAPMLLPLLDRPFALFGHSMGALISFELARFLRRHEQRLPAQLFVSGQQAPQITQREEPAHLLPKPAFIERLRQLNGTPEEILSDGRLLDLLLPVLRADFELCETYRFIPEEPFVCPITAFGGEHDFEATHDDLLAWREHTCDTFELRTLPGNHFFITTSQELLLQLLTDDLVRLVNQHDLEELL